MLRFLYYFGNHSFFFFPLKIHPYCWVLFWFIHFDSIHFCSLLLSWTRYHAYSMFHVQVVLLDILLSTDRIECEDCKYSLQEEMPTIFWSGHTDLYSFNRARRSCIYISSPTVCFVRHNFCKLNGCKMLSHYLYFPDH